MKDNYYEDFLLEVKQLINDEKYEQAQVKLKNELDLPYIQDIYELEIKKLYQEVNYQQKLNQQQITVWDLATIQNVLNNPFDEEIHLVAFNFLEQHNVRQILSTLKDYLKNPLFSNQNKTHMLLELKKQAIDEGIDVVKTHGKYLINPVLMDFFHDDARTLTIKKILDDKIHINNPGLGNICWYIWENYWYTQYPLLFEETELLSAVCAFVFKAQAMIGVEENNLEKICVEISGDVVITNKILEKIESEKIF